MIPVSQLSIRSMAPEDLHRVADLEAQAYSQPWNAHVFADELGQESRSYLVIEEHDTLLGYGGLMVIGSEAHITTVVVHPDRREDRLGTRIMVALCDEAVNRSATSMTLEVRVSNEAAQSLYRRFGMTPVGVRKKYYRDEDALIMWVHDIDGAAFAERVDAIRGALR